MSEEIGDYLEGIFHLAAEFQDVAMIVVTAECFIDGVEGGEETTFPMLIDFQVVGACRNSDTPIGPQWPAHSSILSMMTRTLHISPGSSFMPVIRSKVCGQNESIRSRLLHCFFVPYR